MNGGEIIELIRAEVERAMQKHPAWPNDPVHAAAIVSEEAGELTRAANRFYCRDYGTVEEMEKEAVQTGAMAYRFLLNLETYKSGQNEADDWLVVRFHL